MTRVISLEDILRRVLSALAVSTLVVTITTGCQFMQPVRSLDPYAPSDGFQTDIDELKARNFMLLELDNEAALIGSFVNSGDVDLDVTVQIISGDNRSDTFVEVPAGGKTDMGYNGNPPKRVDLPDEIIAGQLYPIFIQVEQDTPRELLVPVMDGSLEEYQQMIDLLN
ncbi:MAG: hypothetical protein RI590_03030 [Microbacteriaceae bacterium]|nr:hypothetical protein [Microbacteriaceae bacterium]MDR9444222.1 hypothetical protein [Microbacteriaceae bacterium]